MPPSPKPPGSLNPLSRAPRAATARGWVSRAPRAATASLPRLYAIVDVECCAAAGRLPLDVVVAFLSAGVRLIQLRAKTWDSGVFLDLAEASVSEARAAGAVLIVNDRADVATMAGADGVHLGQEDLTPADARRVVGASSWVGLSTHTETQWTVALDAPISYLAIGPVFGTGTKATGYQAVGLETVQRVSAAAGARGLPVVAIGGITLERAASVIAAGATAVAVISDLLSDSPEARARAFMHALT